MDGAYKRDEIEAAAAAAAKLVSVYKNDLDQTLGTELVQFSAFVNHCLEEENDKTSRHHFLYKLLVDKKVVDTFPNVLGAYGHKLFWRKVIQQIKVHQEKYLVCKFYCHMYTLY